MQELKEYLKMENWIIVGIVDDHKLLGFTVTDLHMERACAANFETASMAMNWADNNFKGLL